VPSRRGIGSNATFTPIPRPWGGPTRVNPSTQFRMGEIPRGEGMVGAALRRDCLSCLVRILFQPSSIPTLPAEFNLPEKGLESTEISGFPSSLLCFFVLLCGPLSPLRDLCALCGSISVSSKTRMLGIARSGDERPPARYACRNANERCGSRGHLDPG